MNKFKNILIIILILTIIQVMLLCFAHNPSNTITPQELISPSVEFPAVDFTGVSF